MIEEPDRRGALRDWLDEIEAVHGRLAEAELDAAEEPFRRAQASLDEAASAVRPRASP